jgi:hypothetical protein
MTKPAISGAAYLRAKNIFAAEAAAVEKVQPNPAKPTHTQSQRDAILDALAAKVLRRERLPRRITLGGEEVDTGTFLFPSRHDRRPASGMLARLAPECFVGNALTSECVSQIAFAIEAQTEQRAQRVQATPAKPNQLTAQ